MAGGKETPKEEKQEPSVRRGSKSIWPWKKETDGSASFLRAARAGNLEKVLEFLKTNTDINTCNANGLNALHLASKEGHTDVVSALLDRSANVDAATKKGNTALHIASLAGQDEIVKVLVEHGATVNIQSQNGFTPLYMAAQENHDSVVRFLLSHGANQSLATEDGFTPLAVALQQGHDRVVSVLLENDTRGKVRLPALHIAAKKDDAKAAALLLHTDHNPDITSKSGFTPLHIASHYGNDNIAGLLIQRGADVNYVAKHQITPLHVASKWGKGNMVSLLLDKGANIEAKTRDGLTPLHCAARSGHETVVDMLLEKGAPITAKTKNGLAPLHMASQGDHVDAARILLYHKAPVDDVTVDFLTALHVAAHCGHVRVAKLLLDRKADPNSRALNGFTPLHIACKKNRIKVVELLLKHGASIEATTESGLTPLHVASFMGCMNIVIYLIQHGASADVPTVRGESPLHLAARANQTDIIRILLRNGAEVDAKAREQQTALHIASRLGNTDIVGLLLQQGASVDAPTKDLYTPLHIAAKEGQEEVAGVLLDHGASLNTPTKKGFTPLHLAAKYGHLKVARLLLQRDAPVDPKGKNGVTPLHVAAHYDHQNVAMLLLDKGAQPHATAKNGYTPLHIAARKNQMDIAGTLLEYGANANAESKAGFTPLHLSAQEGHTDMATLLLEHGAQPGGSAKNGLTPLHLCAQEDRVPVGAILVKHGAAVDAQTKAGYTPLHVAAHFGQMNMVRFLLQHGTKVDAPTQLGYTPLHQAAQQGHTQIVNLLLENKAQPNMETNDGKTALSIAQRLGYISVVETLKIVTETRVQTNTTTTTEEKYKVVVPETMHETFMSESEDEGADDTMLGDQSYRYLTVDEMKSLGDDSLPIDVTRDEKMDVSFQSNLGAAPGEHISPQHKKEAALYTQNYPTDNIDVGKAPILAGPESLNTTMNTTFNPPEDDVVAQFNDESRTEVPDQGTTPKSPSPATVTPKTTQNEEVANNIWDQFLVSFMVDARGGAMRGCRHSGVRVIIPPRKAAMPMRITCRYLKKDKLVHAPPLMEGEALSSRILEMGPSGAKFLGPVIIEVPHFASLRGKEREIVILRSDNGETWREHTLEATEEAVQEVLNESFDGEELKQLEDLNTNRITRILTTDFPQYFAIVTRIRQEVHAIGPEGGMVSSTVVPQVQAVFPQGALTKKIKVGLQAQPISTDLVAKLLGNRVAVSPIVTVEPRRRKFHKPITLTIPVPQAASKGMINQYSGEAPTLRLLCSITGGTTRAQWEDVTGSTPLTFVNDCVSFTTTVSARFWLMDCTNIPEATKMATELYREAIHVPFMAKFVVFSKRHQQEEARVRVFCMTDDKEDKTLESQEHFIEVAKSRDVEVLEGKSQYLEFAGNLIPVTKSGDQLAFNFYAFRENRLPFTVRVKDQNAEPVGRVAFMRQPKVGRGEAPQSPICTLNLSLPDNIQPEPAPSEPDLLALEKKYAFLSISKAETIHKADLRLSDISNMLASDWVALAKELEISDSDINIIKTQYPDNTPQQAIVMLRLWMQTSGNKATGNTLEKALRTIHRDDIVNECICNMEIVTDVSEKATAEEVLVDKKPQSNLVEEITPPYDEKDIMKDAESVEEEEIAHKTMTVSIEEEQKVSELPIVPQPRSSTIHPTSQIIVESVREPEIEEDVVQSVYDSHVHQELAIQPEDHFALKEEIIVSDSKESSDSEGDKEESFEDLVHSKQHGYPLDSETFVIETVKAPVESEFQKESKEISYEEELSKPLEDDKNLVSIEEVSELPIVPQQKSSTIHPTSQIIVESVREPEVEEDVVQSVYDSHVHQEVTISPEDHFVLKEEMVVSDSKESSDSEEDKEESVKNLVHSEHHGYPLDSEETVHAPVESEFQKESKEISYEDLSKPLEDDQNLKHIEDVCEENLESLIIKEEDHLLEDRTLQLEEPSGEFSDVRVLETKSVELKLLENEDLTSSNEDLREEMKVTLHDKVNQNQELFEEIVYPPVASEIVRESEDITYKDDYISEHSEDVSETHLEPLIITEEEHLLDDRKTYQTEKPLSEVSDVKIVVTESSETNLIEKEDSTSSKEDITSEDLVEVSYDEMQQDQVYSPVESEIMRESEDITYDKESIHSDGAVSEEHLESLCIREEDHSLEDKITHQSDKNISEVSDVKYVVMETQETKLLEKEDSTSSKEDITSEDLVETPYDEVHHEQEQLYETKEEQVTPAEVLEAVIQEQEYEKEKKQFQEIKSQINENEVQDQKYYKETEIQDQDHDKKIEVEDPECDKADIQENLYDKSKDIREQEYYDEEEPEDLEYDKEERSIKEDYYQEEKIFDKGIHIEEKELNEDVYIKEQEYDQKEGTKDQEYYEEEGIHDQSYDEGKIIQDKVFDQDIEIEDKIEDKETEFEVQKGTEIKEAIMDEQEFDQEAIISYQKDEKESEYIDEEYNKRSEILDQEYSKESLIQEKSDVVVEAQRDHPQELFVDEHIDFISHEGSQETPAEFEIINKEAIESEEYVSKDIDSNSQYPEHIPQVESKKEIKLELVSGLEDEYVPEARSESEAEHLSDHELDVRYVEEKEQLVLEDKCEFHGEEEQLIVSNQFAEQNLIQDTGIRERLSSPDIDRSQNVEKEIPKEKEIEQEFDHSPLEETEVVHSRVDYSSDDEPPTSMEPLGDSEFAFENKYFQEFEPQLDHGETVPKSEFSIESETATNINLLEHDLPRELDHEDAAENVDAFKDSEIQEDVEKETKSQDGLTQSSAETSQMESGQTAPSDVKPPTASVADQPTSDLQLSEKVAGVRSFGENIKSDEDDFSTRISCRGYRYLEESPELISKTDSLVDNLVNESTNIGNIIYHLEKSIKSSQNRTNNVGESETKSSGTQALQEWPSSNGLLNTAHRPTTLNISYAGEVNENESNDSCYNVRENELIISQNQIPDVNNQTEFDKFENDSSKKEDISAQGNQVISASKEFIQKPEEVADTSGPRLERVTRPSIRSAILKVKVEKRFSMNQSAKEKNNVGSAKESVQSLSELPSTTLRNTSQNTSIEDEVLGLMAEVTEVTKEIKKDVKRLRDSESPTPETPTPLREFKDFICKEEEQESARLPTISEIGKEADEEGTTCGIAGEMDSNLTYKNHLGTLSLCASQTQLKASINNSNLADVSQSKQNYEVLGEASAAFSCDVNSIDLNSLNVKAPFSKSVVNLEMPCNNRSRAVSHSSNKPVLNNAFTQTYSNLGNKPYGTISDFRNKASLISVRSCYFCTRDFLLNDVCNDLIEIISFVEQGVKLSKKLNTLVLISSLDNLKYKLGSIFEENVNESDKSIPITTFDEANAEFKSQCDSLSIENESDYYLNKRSEGIFLTMPSVKNGESDKQPILLAPNAISEGNGPDYLTDVEELTLEDGSAQNSPSHLKKTNKQEEPLSDEDKVTDEEDIENSDFDDDIENKKDEEISIENFFPVNPREVLSLTEGYARDSSPILSEGEHENIDIEKRHLRNVRVTSVAAEALDSEDVIQGLTDEENMIDVVNDITESEKEEDVGSSLPDHYLQEDDSVSKHEAVTSASFSKNEFNIKKSIPIVGQTLQVHEEVEEKTDVEDLESESGACKKKPKRRKPRAKKSKFLSCPPPAFKTESGSGELTDTEILLNSSDSSSDGYVEGFDERYLTAVMALKGLTDTEDLNVSDEDEGDLLASPVPKDDPQIIPEPIPEKIKISEKGETENIEDIQDNTDEENFNLEESEDQKPVSYSKYNLPLKTQIVTHHSDSSEGEDAVTDTDDVNIEDKDDEEIINDYIQRLPKEDTNVLLDMECESASDVKGKINKSETKNDKRLLLTVREEDDEALTDVEEWDEKGGINTVKNELKIKKLDKLNETDSENFDDSEEEKLPRRKSRKILGRSKTLPIVPLFSEFKFVESDSGPLSIVITPDAASDSSSKICDNIEGVVFLEDDNEAVTDIEDVESSVKEEKSKTESSNLNENQEQVTDTEEFEAQDIFSNRPATPLPPDDLEIPSPRREKIYIVEDEFGVPHVRIEKLDTPASEIFEEINQVDTDTENVEIPESEIHLVLNPQNENDDELNVYTLSETGVSEVSSKFKTKKGHHLKAKDTPLTDEEEIVCGKKGKRKPKSKKRFLEAKVEEEGNTDVELLSGNEENLQNNPSATEPKPDTLAETECEQFESSGEYETYPKETELSPKFIHMSGVKQVVLRTEKSDGSFKTEIIEEKNSNTKTVAEDSIAATDTENLDISEAEEVYEGFIPKDSPSSNLPANEESNISVSLKAFSSHARRTAEAEDEIKENLLLPEAGHTDVESLDEGEETGEPKSTPDDSSKPEASIASVKSPLMEVDLAVLDSFLISQEAEVEEMTSAETKPLTNIDSVEHVLSPEQPLSTAVKMDTKIKSTPPPPPPRVIFNKEIQPKHHNIDASSELGEHLSSDDADDQLALMKDSPRWEDEEIKAEDPANARPIKAEIKLMVKTTEVGKESIEIRSIREFVDRSDKPTPPININNEKQYLDPNQNKGSDEKDSVCSHQISHDKCTSSPKFVRPKEKYSPSFYEEGSDDFDLLAQVRDIIEPLEKEKDSCTPIGKDPQTKEEKK